ncbi:MAG: hypothetical protein IJO14_00215 [Clostridia bacterium]|nr:hypothetical protein [Clostridia bacterium]
MDSVGVLLRRDAHILRRACKRELQRVQQTEQGRWLTDNYHLLHAACTDALHFLRTPRKDTADGRQERRNLFALCCSLLPDGALPTEEDLFNALDRASLSLADCAEVPFFLYAAAVHSAATGVETDNADLLIHAVKSVLALREIDFETHFSAYSAAERLLLQDPSGHYADMDIPTKQAYRRSVQKLSVQEGKSQIAFLTEKLTLARNENHHIGFYLALPAQKQTAGFVFTLAEAVSAVLLSFAAAWLTGKWFLFFVLLLPVFAIVRPVWDALSVHLVSQPPLLSMRPTRNVPEKARTLLTVAGILPDASKAQGVGKHLEQLYTANANGAVKVLFLADPKPAPNPEMPSDKADIAAMCRVIDKLNERYGGGFLFAVRGRVFSPTQGEYTAHERKRGALVTLASVIAGNADSGFAVLHGDTQKLKDTRYLFTLDADTVLSFDTLSFAVAAAMHPLNRPRTDAACTRVEQGFAVIVPSARVSLQSAAQSLFSVLMNDGGGAGVYTSGVSERGMALFGSSNFTGKGLVDVRLFHRLCRSFPQQYVLSHDCLEGGILRTAFDGRGSFTDSFPVSERSYFERLHRWLRGDWQNARFLFMPVGKCRLPANTKLLLADNLRRAVTPIAAMVLLAVSLFCDTQAAFVLQLAAVLSSCAGDLFAALRTVFAQGPFSLSSRYFSSRIPGEIGAFVRCLLLVGMLPQTVWCCVSAAVRSLWRMLVSHKRLLEWKTAAQSDSAAASQPLQHIVFPLACAGVLFWTGTVFARVIGLLFAVNVVFSLFASARVPQRQQLTSSQKDMLLSDCAAMWKFFEENAGEEDHFLPPDNLQETPVFRIAHRTSPTNIGLYLCCILAAADFSFIDASGLCTRISRTLDTVEKLEKAEGNLLNWYDTRTLQALPPRYVSTVDSGNFLCCLAALEQGLQTYLPACPQLQTQILRIRKLLKNTDLRNLYNENRRLFYVGMDADTRQKSPSCYDLYMSEARMTSFLAVASGQVPGEHWRSLGRTAVRKDSFSGAVSWTGTFFEYFMPCLFLPVPDNSFSAESLSFCLYVQKRHAAHAGIPWGITESGYYACDSALNYAYKAHGVAPLALKRVADYENVVAPYASYLALLQFPRLAVHNLNRLRTMHLYGRYGFCEAADFTPKRTNGEDYCVVRSYMAHHVGMSLLGAANCLTDGIFVRRFMSNPMVSPAAGLLEEKASACTRVFRDVQPGTMPLLPVRPDRAQETVLCENVFFAANGEWTSLADRYGRNVQVFAGNRLLQNRTFCGGTAVACIYKDQVYPLAADAACNMQFSQTAVSSQQQCGPFSVRTAQAVHPTMPAALFPVRVDNTAQERQKAAVCFYLEPLLLPVFSADEHPAYSRLFVSCSYDEEEKIFIFGRQNAENGLFMAVGLWDSAPFSFETDREQVLFRGGADAFPVTASFGQLQNNLSGTDRCLALHIPVAAEGGESVEHTLILTAAATPSEAAQRLRAVRARPLPDTQKCALNPFTRQPRLLHTAENICAQLFFDAPAAKSVKKARLQAVSRADLWAAGVSGDVPVVLLETQAEDERSQLVDFITLQSRMTALGLAADFVFVRGRTGGYSDTPDAVVRETAAGIKGFAEVLPKALQKSSLTDATLSSLRAFSLCVLPYDREETLLPQFVQHYERLSVTPAQQENGAVPCGWQFSHTPPVPWCVTQSNSVFGFLAADDSPGFTWAGNAQRNKITPWRNDTRAGGDGEELLLGNGTSVWSLCKGAACQYTDTQAVYMGSADGIAFRLAVAADAKAQRKRLSVYLKNTTAGQKNITLAYQLQPILSASAADSRFVRACGTDGNVLMYNPVNADVPGFALLSCDRESFCSFAEDACFAFLHGEGKLPKEAAETLTQQTAVCTKLSLPSGASSAVVFTLQFARTQEALQKLSLVPFVPKKSIAAQIRTGDPVLDAFGNGLLLHTVLDTRFSARCGFWQCGGAWGFRDQLQDALCLMYRTPHLTRRQILRCAAAQFAEGDVLHWHHVLFPKGERKAHIVGVRTRCSDDLLWLPFVTALYVLHTKDVGILQTKIAYLQAEQLRENEKDRYARYERGDTKSSLYAHCVQAIVRACRFGEHGLPLMGGGDWNDAMGAVGENGKGESVWLAMFLSLTLERFSEVCDLVGDRRHFARFRALAASVKMNIDRCAWEEDRYLRAFFDDGTPLGAEDSPACTLDVLPQSFAVFCSMPDRHRVRTALATAYNRLFDPRAGLVRLFETPFEPHTKYAGYINFYPVGVRENGGQYTHAAVWFALALLQAGLREQAKEVAKAICPAMRYEQGKDAAAKRYRAEPYAPCGDVAAVGELCGRGGWSLYTGSAGWFLLLLKMLSDE